MIAGWRGYFEWFPDYYIEVTDVFGDDDKLALLVLRAAASRTTKARAGLPVAWKPIVKDSRVTLWQVFADTTIPFQIIERNS
jgi:hypothetical protein